MVDFTKLRDQTPQERAEAAQRREAEAAARDLAERQAKVKHTRTITLQEDSEIRFSRTGDREILLRGTDEQGRPLRAAYTTPFGTSRDAADALAESLTAGSTAKLAGYFRPHQDGAGKTHFTMAVMTVENDHTRAAAQDRTAGAAPGADAVRQREEAAWEAEIALRNAHAAKAARDFADLVRNHRDEALLLSAERRTLAERYAAEHQRASETLGGIAGHIPTTFEAVPYATMIARENAFLVIDLDAKRNRRDPLDRELQIREMGYVDLGGDLYAENRTAGPDGTGLLVHPLSIRTEMPDDRDQILWDDLRRNADQARATERGQPRDFLVLPLAGPVAEHPSMVKAAQYARSIQADGGEALNRLGQTSVKLRSTNENLARITDQVLDRAWTLANAEGRPPYDDAKTAAVQRLDWEPSRDRYADALTSRRPIGQVGEASAALNSQPLANAVLTYVAAKGRGNWTQILDLPDLHADLTRSNTPAPSARIEIRGSRSLEGERRPETTATNEFDAMRRGERTALSFTSRPGEPSGLDALKPGDILRLHKAKREEPKAGYLEVMVTGRPVRVDRSADPERLDHHAKLEGVTADALRARTERLGEIAQVPVRVIATDAIARPHPSAGVRKSAGQER